MPERLYGQISGCLIKSGLACEVEWRCQVGGLIDWERGNEGWFFLILFFLFEYLRSTTTTRKRDGDAASQPDGGRGYYFLNPFPFLSSPLLFSPFLSGHQILTHHRGGRLALRWWLQLRLPTTLLFYCCYFIAWQLRHCFSPSLFFSFMDPGRSRVGGRRKLDAVERMQ